MIVWVYFRIAFWHDTLSQLLVVTTVAPRFFGSILHCNFESHHAGCPSFFRLLNLNGKKGHVMTTLTIGDVGGQFYAIFGMDYLADAPHDVHHRGPLIVNSR